MSIVAAFVTQNGLPVSGLGDSAVSVNVYNATTPAPGSPIVVDGDLTEVGGGWYRRDFPETDGIDTVAIVDAGATIIDPAERFIPIDAMSGTTTARLETTIPAISVNTATDIPASIAAVAAAVDVIDGIVDTINANVGLLPTLISAVPGQVGALDPRENLQGAVNASSTLLATLQTIRLMLLGRAEPTTPGDPNNVALYNDDDSVRVTMAIADLNTAGGILSPPGVPAKRGRAV